MPGGNRRGFGRGAGMKGGAGRKGGMFTKICAGTNAQAGWANLPAWNKIYQPEPDELWVSDETADLKELASNTKAQLDAVNSRLRNTEKTFGPLCAQIDQALCMGCMQCLSACPRNAIELSKDYPLVNRNKCTGCGICLKQCPADAIQLTKAN